MKENKNTIERSVKPKVFFFFKINKIDNPLARLTEIKKSRQIIKMRNERGDFTSKLRAIKL